MKIKRILSKIMKLKKAKMLMVKLILRWKIKITKGKIKAQKKILYKKMKNIFELT